VTTRKIARDYLGKVEARLDSLRLFLGRGRYDDVVREAHEAIELLLKGALHFVGILFERSEAEEAIRAVERLLGLYRVLLDTAKD